MFLDIPLLTFIIWLPILVGCAMLIFSDDAKDLLAIFISLITSIFSLVLCYLMYSSFRKDYWSMQLIEKQEWIVDMGIFYMLGVDGVSMPLIILTCLMTFTVIIFSCGTIKERVNQYYAHFLIMQGLVCGVFSALDTILFYIFFEAMLIPMFLIIGIWGGSNRVYATIKFFIYTFLGSVFFLLSLIYLHYALYFNFGHVTFSILKFQSLYLSINQQKLLFWTMLFAFAIKVPMWPVHTWLPDAHVEAPTGGSVILAAITLKVGGYGIIRFLLPIVPDGCLIFSNLIIILSFIAIVYIGLVAIVQTDMKKLIAYSSISHMGFVTLGCFTLFAFNFNSEYYRESIIGVEGAMIQMISHGFISGAMFICVGILYERLHTKLISKFGGIVNKMPFFATLFMIFVMANSGLPGTSGFVGELIIILSVFKANYIYALVAGLTLILGATYNLWMYKRVIFGTINNVEILNISDIKLYEKIPLILLAVLIILFGIWPAPFINLIHPSIEHIVYQTMQSKVFLGV